ncbi:unnamed protein product [Symbiodinium sp. KB8]|nr:unnamed protein product [Symbiodinium sp. KB8]
MLHFRGQAHAATAALPAWEQWLAQVRAELRAAKLAVAWGGTSLSCSGCVVSKRSSDSAGAQRGILHMAGRSRLAGFGDSSWPQLLQWRQDLEDSRRKILSAFRLDFPEARRGKGKGHGRIPGQDPWLSSSPRARAALLTLAKGLPLEDLDCQFILCEIGKQLGGRRETTTCARLWAGTGTLAAGAAGSRRVRSTVAVLFQGWPRGCSRLGKGGEVVPAVLGQLVIGSDTLELQWRQVPDLSHECLRNAVFLQSCCSCGRASTNIHHDLHHWWRTEGERFVTVNSMDGDPADDSVEGDEEEWHEPLDPSPEDTVDPTEHAAQEALDACDDHLKVKTVIEELRENMEAMANEPVAVPALPDKADGKDEDANEGWDTKLDVSRFVDSWRELPSVQVQPTKDTNLQCLMRRVAEIQPLLVKFCTAIQLAARVLSRAQVTGEHRAANTWNDWEHELALARQASLATAVRSRMSRLQAWTSRQEKMHGPGGKDDGVPLQRVTTFGSHASVQILLFVKDDSTIGYGCVQTVFRAAVLTGKTSTRRLRVARPSTGALPPNMCQSVRVVELMQMLRHKWYATSLNPSHRLLPEQVIAQILPVEVRHDADKMAVVFSEEAVKLTEAFLAKKPWLSRDAEPAAVTGPAASETVEGLTTRSFLPQSCTKTVPLFMSKLPEMWAKQSSPILDDSGCFETFKKKVEWTEISSRAVSYFDVVCTGKQGVEYSKLVHGCFAGVLPHKDGSLQRLRKLVQDIDQIAPEWLPLK